MGMNQTPALQELRKRHPWPNFELPRAIPNLTRGNVVKGLKDVISLLLGVQDPVIVEVGSELGGGARLFVDTLDNATVICLDKWPIKRYGSTWQRPLKGITNNAKYGTWGAFTYLCRDYKNNIISMKGDRLDSLKEIHQCGIQPHMVYLDCLHMYKPLLDDLNLVNTLFPKTIISGDDWRSSKRGDKRVQRAVNTFVGQHGFSYDVYDNQYVIKK